MPLAKGAIDATLPLSVARASHVLGQTGTVRPRRTSKTVWTKRQAVRAEGTQPRRSRGHRGDKPCPMGTLARYLSRPHPPRRESSSFQPVVAHKGNC